MSPTNMDNARLHALNERMLDLLEDKLELDKHGGPIAAPQAYKSIMDSIDKTSNEIQKINQPDSYMKPAGLR